MKVDYYIVLLNGKVVLNIHTANVVLVVKVFGEKIVRTETLNLKINYLLEHIFVEVIHFKIKN